MNKLTEPIAEYIGYAIGAVLSFILYVFTPVMASVSFVVIAYEVVDYFMELIR